MKLFRLFRIVIFVFIIGSSDVGAVGFPALHLRLFNEFPPVSMAKTQIDTAQSVTTFDQAPLSLQTTQETSPHILNIQGFHLLTSMEGWLWLDQGLYWTHSAGWDWIDITPANLENFTIRAVMFLNNHQGWLVLTSPGENQESRFALARTRDGGNTWQIITMALYQSGDVDALAGKVFVQFMDGDTGWLVVKRATGSNFDIGSLFKTTDGGDTWQRLILPIGDPVYFISKDIGWVAGGVSGAELYSTIDGGFSWQVQTLGNPALTDHRQGIYPLSVTYQLPSFSNGDTGVMPVIVTKENLTFIEFYISHDLGLTWEYVNQVNLRSEIYPGTPIPISIVDTNQWKIIDPVGQQLMQVTDLRFPSELVSQEETLGGITKLDMVTPDIGWAQFSSGSCTPDSFYKRKGLNVGVGSPDFSCKQEVNLLQTMDGGRTWRVLGLPPEVANQTTPTSQFTLPFEGQGFDACEIPKTSQMQTWWTSSPYYFINLYIGGISRACGNSSLNAAKVSELSDQGWKFIPTWVGLQASCSTLSHKMSSDPVKAYNQGVAEANSAVDVVKNLGLTFADGTGSIIYYDLEAYNTGNSSCRAAAKSFISGWTNQLHARGNQAAVYGSGCTSALNDFLSLPQVPEAIWPAYWIYSTYNEEATVWDVACLPNTSWADHQRIRQYTGDHDETWGNVTINIDSNVADGILSDISNLSPYTPLPLIPLDGYFATDNLAPTLCWSNPGDPDGDTLKYYTEVIQGNVVANSGWISNTCWRPDVLDGMYNLYSWHVKAKDSHGAESDWSTTWYFITQLLDDSPMINFSTANGSSCISGSLYSQETSWIFNGMGSDTEGPLNRVEFRCSGDSCNSTAIAKLNGLDWNYARNNLFGRNDIYFMAYDNRGLSTASRHLDLNIDQAVPTTTLSLNSDTNPLNWLEWFTAPVKIRLHAEDGFSNYARSGIAQVAYRIDQGSWQTQPGSDVNLLISSDGAHVIDYYAKDNAGNQESLHSASFQLDQNPPTPPTGVIEIHGVVSGEWQKVDPVPSFAWSDSADVTSGLAYYQFYFGADPDGLGYDTFLKTGPHQWSPQPTGVRTGTDYLRGRTGDNAGNWSAWTDLFIFRYDVAMPDNPTGIIHSEGITTTWQNISNQADFVWLGAEDEGAGVQGEFVYWGGDPVGTNNEFITSNDYHNASPLCGSSQACTGYLRFRSLDNVGNSAPDWTTAFILRYDDADPVVEFSINDGITHTNQVTVTLTITASDIGSGVNALRLSGDGVDWTSWEVYSTTREWVIPGISGQSWPVFLQVQDKVGLISSAALQAIYYDGPPGNPTPIPIPREAPPPLPKPICEIPTIRINNDAAFTNQLDVNLSLCAPDAVLMRVSNDNSFTGSVWQSYIDSIDWNLASSGVSTLPRLVYVQFQDASGTLYNTYFDDILYDAVPPEGEVKVGNPAGMASESTSTVDLYLIARDDNSGISEMQLSDLPAFTGATWEAYVSYKAWSPGSGDGSKIVYARFRDQAENISVTSSASFVIDRQPPTGHLTVPGVIGAHELFIKVSLTWHDNLSTRVNMRISTKGDFSDTVWQPYTTVINLPLNLTEGQTQGTVYVQYRDMSGYLSITYSAIFLIDNQAPSINAEVSPGITLTRQLTIQAEDLYGEVTSLYLSNDPRMLDDVVSLVYSEMVSWTFDDRKVVWIQVIDSFGNLSAPYPLFAGYIEGYSLLPIVIR